MMLTSLADIARSAGLAVVEVPGWKDRTRPGGMDGVKTVVCHHTGGLKDLNTIIKGRDLGLPTELRGPLAQFFLARDGLVHVVAAGRANHAGAVLKASYGNGFAIGIEAEAVGIPGTKDDWPPVQMAAYARLCKALVDHFGLSVLDVRGHKEVCSPPGRKADPDFNMTDFRERVAKVRAAQTPQEDDVPLSDPDIAKVAKEVWTTVPALVGQQAGGALHELDLRSESTEKRLAALETALTAVANQAASNGGQLSNLGAKVDRIIAALTPPAQ